jgi:alanine racemase
MWASTIAALLLGNADKYASVPDVEIQELIIDTRKIVNASHAVFFALKGANRDGHQFIEIAYRKGIRWFVVQSKIALDQYPQAHFIEVEDTLQALQLVGRHRRLQFTYPVIGITGSNGKTIVKEWLYELLAHCPPYNEMAGPIRSPKSYNSQIGIPLSTWLMQENNTIGIFEAGISKPGEMEKALAIIQPTIGIFTNIGEAHNEGFVTIQDKIEEKLKLFASVEQLVYSKDQEKIQAPLNDFLAEQGKAGHEIKTFTWATQQEADLKVTSIQSERQNTHIKAIFKGSEIAIDIPYLDKAYIENAIHCWAVLLMLGIAQESIQPLMANLQPVAMRLQLAAGINNSTIINDTYNSDYTSLKIAIDFLLQQNAHQQKTLILSDIFEVRQDDERFYERVAQLLAQKQIDRLIGIGEKISKYRVFFEQNENMHSTFFTDTKAFLSQFQAKQFGNETILLKGARSFEFEKIETLLEEKTHKTIMEVDLSAIQNNINVYKSYLKPGVKLMAMVKAFAYGTGSVEIANILQYEGVDYLTVAYLDEGIELRKAGISLPIMVMSPEFGAFDQMISWKIEPEIFSMLSLEQFLRTADQMGVEQYPIHIKLDTGMHRLGFSSADLPELINVLQHTKAVKVQSMFSHLVGSDEAAFDGFTEQQAKLYKEMSSTLIEGLGYKPIRHLCNSAAISRFPDLQYDMVRLGIGMYGVDANPKTQEQLRNVGTLKTTVAQVRSLSAGETVGYSRRGKITKDTTIATVSIGYADGYFRDFGNGNAYMLINGKPVRTLGSVCMDMCMLDVSDVGPVKAGDRVVVFGSDLPLTTLAQWANTIPYEIISSVSQRVKRVYINEA